MADLFQLFLLLLFSQCYADNYIRFNKFFEVVPKFLFPLLIHHLTAVFIPANCRNIQGNVSFFLHVLLYVQILFHSFFKYTHVFRLNISNNLSIMCFYYDWNWVWYSEWIWEIINKLNFKTLNEKNWFIAVNFLYNLIFWFIMYVKYLYENKNNHSYLK